MTNKVTEKMTKNAVSAKITHIEMSSQANELIKGMSLDAPVVNTIANNLDLTISGWILSNNIRPLLSIEISIDGFQLKRIPIQVARPDVLKAFSIEGNENLNCGFDTRVGLIGLPEKFKIIIVAVFRGDDATSRVKVDIANFSGVKETNIKVKTKYQPLNLTAIGRSGTTWMMKLLSQHPEILTSNFYPFEVKQSAYWMQLLKITSDPADFEGSSHPDKFDVTMGSIGHNPYTHPHYMSQYEEGDKFRHYYANEMIQSTAEFATKKVDEFYDLVAADEQKSNAKYYAEKFVPTHLQSIYSDVYQDKKEIILVRDFRDMLCSAKSFNEKRNSVAFGRERVSDDIEWVQHVSKAGIKRMANAWEERSKTSFLLKYEELIINPEKTLKALFEYLNIDANESTISNVISKANGESSSMDAHKTTKDPKSSIGRWKTDMSVEMQEMCKQEMGHLLTIFGYEL